MKSTQIATNDDGQYSVLLIEDDDLLVETIIDAMEEYGCSITSAKDADSGLKALQADLNNPHQILDIIVLDLGLPDRDGLELLQSVRAFSNIPIIVLTGRDNEEERIDALELGCDDFIVKPCSPREILAHIKAVMRRALPKDTPQNTDVAGLPDKVFYDFGRWRFDPELHLLIENAPGALSKDKRLSPLSSLILQTLIEAAGRVLSREFILDAAAGKDADVFDRSIDLHILRLRRVIEKNPSAPEYIQTIRGAGYTFKKEHLK